MSNVPFPTPILNLHVIDSLLRPTIMERRVTHRFTDVTELRFVPEHYGCSWRHAFLMQCLVHRLGAPYLELWHYSVTDGEILYAFGEPRSGTLVLVANIPFTTKESRP